MHEQSKTNQVTMNGPPFYQNVTGPGVIHTPGALPPQVPLPPLFPYERSQYPTEAMAVDAAQRRSFDFGQLVNAIMRRHAEATQLQRGLDSPQ